MSGVVKIEINESAQELKRLLKQQKSKQGFERVQVLYLLKTHQVETVQAAAAIVGRHRTTLQEWLRRYRLEGISGMLEVGKSTGRKPHIPEWAVERIKAELSDPEGFSSYQEVKIYLETVLDIKVKYDVVHNLVHDKLKASLKVARSKSKDQRPEAVAKFRAELSQQIQQKIEEATAEQKKYTRIRYWCEDESRFGLKTIERRKLTLRGVKPVGIRQWLREAYYLYGLVEPVTGESFFCEISHLDTECFQAFLDCFAQAYGDDLHLIQVDNAPAHLGKKLISPENIILLTQPPHCPEVNPIERLWEYIKNFLVWELFSDLDKLKARVNKILNSLTQEVIASLSGWQFIRDALSVANI